MMVVVVTLVLIIIIAWQPNMLGERALSTPCMFVSIILKAESKKLQPIRVKVTVRLLSLLLYFSTLVEEFCYSVQPFSIPYILDTIHYFQRAKGRRPGLSYI